MKKKITHALPRTALAAALILELSTGAHAATINVDNNTCTLANAITAANTDTATAACTAGNGDDVIEIPDNSAITLTEALPSITNTVTINANGSVITRDTNAATDFTIITGGFLGTLPKVTINDANINGGINTYNNGGGINLFAGSLELNRSTVSNNSGGGIAVVFGPDSSINNSIISDNITATGYDSNYYGGGLTVSGGNIQIESTTIANNQANSASQQGGGLYLTSFGGETTIDIINSTISGNSAAYEGGGMVLYKNPDASLTVNVTNTSIINNSSNRGGGIFNNEGVLTIGSSLLTGNTAAAVGDNIESVNGSVTSDYNLFGFNSDSGHSGITLGTNDIVPSASNLSDIINTVLADNGGLTPTLNLVENSPAIDAVMPGNCATVNDQIGHLRGNDGNGDMLGGCDMGAVEYQPVVIDLIFIDGFEPPQN